MSPEECPYDVSRGQYQYVTLPLATLTGLLKYNKFGLNHVLIKQNLPNSIILPPNNGGFYGLFIYLFSFAYNYTNNNMHTTISVQPQSANVEKLVSSFVA